jgi:hypothetical protein
MIDLLIDGPTTDVTLSLYLLPHFMDLLPDRAHYARSLSPSPPVL